MALYLQISTRIPRNRMMITMLRWSPVERPLSAHIIGGLFIHRLAYYPSVATPCSLSEARGLAGLDRAPLPSSIFIGNFRQRPRPCLRRPCFLATMDPL